MSPHGGFFSFHCLSRTLSTTDPLTSTRAQDNANERVINLESDDVFLISGGMKRMQAVHVNLMSCLSVWFKLNGIRFDSVEIILCIFKNKVQT